MTIAEQIQALMAEREAMLPRLEAIERELVEAGSVLSMTVKSAAFLRNRGRLVDGDSCRAKIFALLADGKDWRARDIFARIPRRWESVSAQLSRMAKEGDIVRIGIGIYRGFPRIDGVGGQPQDRDTGK